MFIPTNRKKQANDKRANHQSFLAVFMDIFEELGKRAQSDVHFDAHFGIQSKKPGQVRPSTYDSMV